MEFLGEISKFENLYLTDYSNRFEKNLEIICDSTFIRSIFSSDINNIIKNYNPFIRRQMLSLAYLDNNYNLKV